MAERRTVTFYNQPYSFFIITHGAISTLYTDPGLSHISRLFFFPSPVWFYQMQR
ncbi:hypothetical protein M089_4316 [Bacteroides ovatus str. 3725 D9 iii]|nr:hypothetical protein M088_5446 [Bacteroides ovatus str. 3725 D1 iv]KDS26124.1 hypothetical protein M089_4316 [Bacteroides ovatus str. 3725 D9 iii]